MKKIGIASLYTNSRNYGGNLQAFALCSILNSLGYDAKQICYSMSYSKNTDSLMRIINDRRFFKTAYSHFKNIILRMKEKRYGIDTKLNQLSNSFIEFRNEIPHTDVVYNPETIFKCQQFDIYITGSDQVWNLWSSSSLSPFYWLLFVNGQKIKLSYAASVSMNNFPEFIHSDIKNALSDYSGISVREKSDKRLIENLVENKEVSWVLDPTFLVSRKEWDNLSAKNPYKNENYVFAFLIGDDQEQRNTIREFAQQKGLKIITIPYLLHHFRKCDVDFGDIQTCEVPPNLWLSLIRDANCVFTDSFHACVFSSIFHTPFYVFKRSKDSSKESMNSRIYSLMELFGTEDRIIDDSAIIESLPQIDSIDFEKVDSRVVIEKEKSITFLKNAIEG